MPNSPEIPAWYLKKPKPNRSKRFRVGRLFVGLALAFAAGSFFHEESSFSDAAAWFSHAFGEAGRAAFYTSEMDGERIPSAQAVLGESDEDAEPERAEPVIAEKFAMSNGVSVPERKRDAYDLAIPTAHASVILDADSGTILHFEDGKERRPIASLTKMMTALLVMEETDLDDVATVTEEGLFVDGTVVGCPRAGYCMDTRLQVGEQIAVGDLMKAMLMNSANDAAAVLAIHIDGSVAKFAERMNRRARDLGLADTNFCTPSGLEIEGEPCYSSAYDIARIAAEALKHEKIWEIMNLPAGTVIASVDGKYTHELLNTNALLGEYTGLVGAKTGFTPDAGYSLLAVAADASMKRRAVAVVLDDPYRWGDIKDMFAWAFESYEWK